MRELVKFSKMHGIGNDFVLIDNRDLAYKTIKDNASFILDRRFGIGGDQILLLEKSDKGRCFMRIYNPDGSMAEMCGNGIRAVAIYLLEHDKISDESLDIDTAAGLMQTKILPDKMVRVDMGEPVLDGLKIPTAFDKKLISEPMMIAGKRYFITAVSMGNPHAVIFVDDFAEIDLEKEGYIIEHEVSLFPSRINVEFVKVLSRDEIEVKVWERGAGATLACGTGASASLVASVLNGKTSNKVKVHLPGGDLEIELLGNRVFMSGSATKVFDGEILLK